MPDEHTYLDHPRHDDLARMVTELTSELWVLRDRQMVLERLLADHGIVAEDEIDSYQPREEFAQQVAQEREALVARVMGAPHGKDYTVASLVAKGHR